MIAQTAMAYEGTLSPFMTTRGKTAQPIGHHDFCLRYPAECDIHSARAARMKLTPARWNELVDVDNTVNTTITPATDEEVYGRQEYWAYPTTRGDCEDLVLLKRRMLLQKGWPVGTLLITVVRQANGDGHAVLTVLTDRGDLVLDNLDPHILVWSETAYQYVKRQSQFDTGAWVAVDDGRATEVGSLKN
jgi:predicted transglutaminase-like cysteine proteinase